MKLKPKYTDEEIAMAQKILAYRNGSKRTAAKKEAAKKRTDEGKSPGLAKGREALAKMSPERRREICIKASKAASAKAAERRKAKSLESPES